MEANQFRYIYSGLFVGLIQDAIDQWLSENTILNGATYEVIFAHYIDLDGCGAVVNEHFLPIYTESQNY